MKHRNSCRAIPAMLAIVLCLLTSIRAEDTKEDIRKRMESRYAELLKLKKEGVIGETSEGYTELLPSASKKERAKKIVTDENADRKALYALIASDSKSTAAKVGQANAARIYGKAGDTEYFKGKDGVWRRKKEMESKTNARSGEEDKENEGTR
jgi:uncharacterized protein YdbL (DUF1318 family)